MKTYRYYSILRPVGLGTTPSSLRFLRVENFDRRTYISGIHHEAWGFFEVAAPLSLQVCDDCDLIYFEEYPWKDREAEGRAVRSRLNLLSDVRRWTAAREQLEKVDPVEADDWLTSLDFLGDLDRFWLAHRITEDDYFDLCVEFFDDFDWETIRPTARFRLRKEKK